MISSILGLSSFLVDQTEGDMPKLISLMVYGNMEEKERKMKFFQNKNI